MKLYIIRVNHIGSYWRLNNGITYKVNYSNHGDSLGFKSYEIKD